MPHRSLTLLAGLLALSLNAGCRPSTRRAEEGAAAKPQEAPAAPAESASAPAAAIPAPPTGGPEWDEILAELVKGRSAEDQERMGRSQEHLRLAMAYRDRGDFEKARTETGNALEAWPDNLEARKLLAEILELVAGGRERLAANSLGENELNQWRVRLEQAQIEIAKHVRDGERYFNARMYGEALKEFEDAEFKIVHIPYDVKAMNDLLPQVREYALKSRNAKQLEERTSEDEKRRMAEAAAAANEVATKREVIRKIAHLLELAYMAFDQKRFERCSKLCEEILLIDPHYTVARELKEDAIKTRHQDMYYTVLAKKVEEWKSCTDDDEEAVIPWSETVRFPSRDEWATISKRITESIIKTGEGTGAEQDPEILSINNKLDTMKIDMAFDNPKLDDMLNFIRDFTGLNIVLDASIREGMDLEKTLPSFKVRDLVLRNVLKLLLPQYGLDFYINEEKVIFLTTPTGTRGKMVLELHDIRDILVKLQDFAGPRVELVSPQQGAGGGGVGPVFSLDEPKEPTVGEQQIVDLIKENISPGNWEGEQTIESTPNQQLLVSAPVHVHGELREFLQKVRSYTGTMVSVTNRFVAAYDDFLNDVGVDIINRANAGLAGNDYEVTNYNLIGESTGSEEIGPGFTTNESARLESYDLRAQTFHTLLKFDPLTNTGIDPMSNRLTDQGGLGLQYEWIGEQALQIALRALRKSQKATVVSAPRVTVFNTQRSHVMFLTQMAYIQDYETQVSSASAAYDPVVGVLTDGVVLDVRPIVSNDRKYVTLELRPSMAQLQNMRRVDIRPPNEILLDLPWIILQKAETTVTVPDRGTLLISGFRQVVMRDIHSGVPFLEHIPVLNFFFTRNSKVDERKRLFMLVTPEIIDLAEHEEKNF